MSGIATVRPGRIKHDPVAVFIFHSPEPAASAQIHSHHLDMVIGYDWMDLAPAGAQRNRAGILWGGNNH